MLREQNNYAFIDSQNLYRGIENLGWILDWRKFRRYLSEKYAVGTAYLFLGFVAEYKDRYDEFQKAGFVLIFKPVVLNSIGETKGNVDADLVLQAMIDYEQYAKAVVVSSDGDFYSLVRYLYKNQKLEVVLSPYVGTCSKLLKISAQNRIAFVDTLRPKLEQR